MQKRDFLSILLLILLFVVFTAPGSVKITPGVDNIHTAGQESIGILLHNVFEYNVFPAMAGMAVTITAEKTDALFIDNNIIGEFDPGDVISYTVVIQNSGDLAEGVEFNDTIDPNTTLVAGSLSITPIARNDSYDSFGNVGISVPDGAGDVLANDGDPDGGTLSGVTAVQGAAGNVGSATGTSATGSVTMQSDGSFTYEPPVGFTGTDSFTYQVTDNEGDTDDATVSIVVSDIVWFVDNSSGGSNLGTFSDPFTSITSFNASSGPGTGDNIYLAETGTSYTTGIVLQSGQRLVGEGATGTSLGNVLGITVPTYSNALPTVNGTRPVIAPSSGDGITLGGANTVAGLDVENGAGRAIFGNGIGGDTSFSEMSLSNNAGIEIQLVNTTGTFTFNNGSIICSAIDAVHVSGGSVAVTFTETTLTHAGGNAILINNGHSGSFSYQDDGTNQITQDTGTGVSIDGSSGTYNIDNLSVTNGLTGLSINNSGSATSTFRDISITAMTGINLVTAGTVSFGTVNGTNTVSATSGPAVNATNTTIGAGAWTFATLSSTSTATDGINLDAVGGGSFTANGGTITNTGGVAVNLNGLSADFTYAGNIDNNGGGSVEITGRTGGSVTLSGTIDDSGTGIRADGNSGGTITFSGANSVVNTGTITAVSLTNNGATVAFSGGGLDIDATSGIGFNATGGGTVIVTGSGNTITTTGTAININGVTIGTNGITVQSINVNQGATGSDTNAIILTDTGSGTFTVTGDGTTTFGGNGTGGTIQNLTDVDAITLDNTGGRVTLQNMIIQDIGDSGDESDVRQTRSLRDGIHGENVNGGLTLQSVTMRRFSDHAILGALLSDGFSLTSWNGLEIHDSLLEDSNRFHVSGRGDDLDEGMVRVRGLSGTMVVDNSTLRRGGRGLDIGTPETAGTLDVTIQRNTFANLYKEFLSGSPVNVGLRGVNFEARGAHDMVVRIGDPAESNSALGNTFTNNMTASVVIFGQEGGGAPHTGNIDAVISENDFIVTDHSTAQLTPPSFTDFNFPQGGVSLNPAGSGTFEAIVSNNLFDEVMHAAGGLGQLTIGHNTGGGSSEFIVRGNEFKEAWDLPFQLRAEGNGSMAVLVESNTWTEGLVGGPGTNFEGGDCGTGDPTGYCPTPFDGVHVNVRNGGSMDLTIRNEVLPQHDDVNDGAYTFEADVQSQAGNVLNLYLDDNKAPDGYRLIRSDGTFNLYREIASDTTPADILDGNGNTGGNGTVAGGDVDGDNTDPPVVSASGTITPSDTPPTLPSITLPKMIAAGSESGSRTFTVLTESALLNGDAVGGMEANFAAGMKMLSTWTDTKMSLNDNVSLSSHTIHYSNEGLNIDITSDTGFKVPVNEFFADNQTVAGNRNLVAGESPFITFEEETGEDNSSNLIEQAMQKISPSGMGMNFLRTDEPDPVYLASAESGALILPNEPGTESVIRTVPGKTQNSSGAMLFSGENVNATLGNLDPGQQVTITFQATINDPMPAGVNQVENQGTVSGSNFVDIIPTDDPDTPASNDATITPVNLELDLTLMVAEGWRMFSSPINGLTYQVMLDDLWTQGSGTTGTDYSGGTSNVYTWPNNVTGTDPGTWSPLDNFNQTIPAGSGFLMYVYADDVYDQDPAGVFPKTLTLSGPAHTGNITAPMNSEHGGWTLVGNPYSVPVDFVVLQKSDLTDIAYVYDPNATGVSDPGPLNGNGGAWRSTSSGTYGDLSGGIIAPGQGFFVQNAAASSGSLTFTEASKAIGGQFYGKQAEPRDFVRLEVQGESLYNSAWIRFSEDGSANRTGGEALELQPLSQDYALLGARKADGTLLDIAHFPMNTQDLEIPLAVETTRSGQFILTATDLDLPAGMTLYLYDRQTGESMPIGDDTFEYSFILNGNESQKDIQTAKEILAAGAVGPVKAKTTGTDRFLITTSPGVPASELPDEIALGQNYPNPFNPVTIISYQIPVNSEVKLEVYDMLGRRIAILADGQIAAGTHQVSFDAGNLSSGVYLYRLTAGNTIITKKLTVLK